MGVNFDFASQACGPFQTNAFLLWCGKTAVLIDPAVGADLLWERFQQLQENGVRLAAIWNTHGHFDHVCDNAAWKTAFDAPIFCHRDDEFFLEHLREQAIWFGVEPPEVASVDHGLEDGQTLQAGEICARVHHLPGHSPGSVAFDFGEIWIAGDVLFRDSVGRTDLPGGDPQILARSVQKLFALPPHTQIWPGHGPNTTIEREKRENIVARQLLAGA